MTINDVIRRFPECQQLHLAYNAKLKNCQFIHGFINSLLWTGNIESHEYLELTHELIKIDIEKHTKG